MAYLYVPSTSSVSVPEAEDSISASSWHFQQLELHVWSRGKATRSRDWFRRWKKAVWLQRLSTRMSNPSQAETGVAAWTASLAASRVRLIPSPERNSGRMTIETSGLTPGGSSSSRGRGSSSSKTSRACLAPGQMRLLAQSESGETFAAWVARLRVDSSRRRKSASRMNASASSSLESTTGATLNKPIWPTPDAGVLNDREEPETFLERQRFHANKRENPTRAGLTLAIASKIWSTPSANDGMRGEDRARRDTGMPNSSLPTDVQSWPTPRVSIGMTNGMGDPDRAKDSRLENTAAAWPTPATRDYKGANSADHLDVSKGSLHLDQLPNFVAHVWSTPRVAQGGYTRDKGKVGAERLTLEGEAEMWFTPDVPNGGRSNPDSMSPTGKLPNGKKRQVGLANQVRQAGFLPSHPGQTTSTAGDTSRSSHLMLYRRYRATTCCALRSERRALLLMAIRQQGRGWTRRQGRERIRASFRRQLNPTFVYWLMGWKTGSTIYGLQEMGSCRWLQDWRSALSRIEVLDGPPEQLSLFG